MFSEVIIQVTISGQYLKHKIKVRNAMLNCPIISLFVYKRTNPMCLNTYYLRNTFLIQQCDSSFGKLLHMPNAKYMPCMPYLKQVT